MNRILTANTNTYDKDELANDIRESRRPGLVLPVTFSTIAGIIKTLKGKTPFIEYNGNFCGSGMGHLCMFLENIYFFCEFDVDFRDF